MARIDNLLYAGQSYLTTTIRNASDLVHKHKVRLLYLADMGHTYK